jgi:hypothetical protein
LYNNVDGKIICAQGKREESTMHALEPGLPDGVFSYPNPLILVYFGMGDFDLFNDYLV